MADVVVSQLWRFPVKSMGGHRVDAIRIDRRGVHADRLWAVRDLEKGVTASARRLPKLLGCTAAYVTDPGPDAGPGNVPEVIITFPDGTECSSSDAAVHGLLSDLVGREARLVALPPADDTSQHRMAMSDSMENFRDSQVRKDFGLGDTEPLPDTSVFSAKDIITLARFSTPPGTFVDLAPVHLLSSTSLASLSDGDPYDVRRFRPNVLVEFDQPTGPYPEAAWVGGDVEIGSATMRVTIPTIRCVVATRPQSGLDAERGITRQLADRTNRFLGVYADVTRPGLLRVGDVASVKAGAPPNVGRRVWSTVEKAATRQAQRLLEATVLREKQ